MHIRSPIVCNEVYGTAQSKILILSTLYRSVVTSPLRRGKYRRSDTRVTLGDVSPYWRDATSIECLPYLQLSVPKDAAGSDIRQPRPSQHHSEGVSTLEPHVLPQISMFLGSCSSAVWSLSSFLALIQLLWSRSEDEGIATFCNSVSSLHTELALIQFPQRRYEGPSVAKIWPRYGSIRYRLSFFYIASHIYPRATPFVEDSVRVPTTSSAIHNLQLDLLQVPLSSAMPFSPKLPKTLISPCSNALRCVAAPRTMIRPLKELQLPLKRSLLRLKRCSCPTLFLISVIILLCLTTVPLPNSFTSPTSSRVPLNALANALARTSLPLPPPMASVNHLTRHSAGTDRMLRHDFSHPLVLTSYVRRSDRGKDWVELFLFTTGVSMGRFDRNFSADGCLVGTDLYPADWYFRDVMLCSIPRAIRKGEKLSVVLRRDEVLERALSAPVNLSNGLVAELTEGDQEILSENDTLHGSLSHSSKYMTVRSSEHYANQDPFTPSSMASVPRYETCLMTHISPYIYMLPDWIDYHRRLGLDMVYIFDNHARSDLRDTFKHRLDVEIIYWPWYKTQTQALSYFLIASRARCEFVLFTDVDEYVMLGLGESAIPINKPAPFKKLIHRVMRTDSNVLQFKIRYLVMTNSGYMYRPDMPVPEAYTHRSEPNLGVNGKSVCRTDVDWMGSAVHSCVPVRGSAVGSTELSFGMYPAEPNDPSALVHFWQRSWEDWITRMSVGRSSTMSLQPIESQTVNLSFHDVTPEYLAIDVPEKKEYTHFQDIWRRVSSVLDMKRQTIVRNVVGGRCKSEMNLEKGQITELKRLCE